MAKAGAAIGVLTEGGLVWRHVHGEFDVRVGLATMLTCTTLLIVLAWAWLKLPAKLRLTLQRSTPRFLSLLVAAGATMGLWFLSCLTRLVWEIALLALRAAGRAPNVLMAYAPLLLAIALTVICALVVVAVVRLWSGWALGERRLRQRPT